MSCCVLAVLGVASLWVLLHLDARVTVSPHVLTTAKDAGPEAASYLASYLLPFLTVSSPSVRDVVAYIGFLVVAGAVQLRSSVIQVNPLLYVLGYRVLAVEDDRGLKAYLVSRGRPAVGERVLASRFRDDVLIDRSSR